MSYGDLLCDYNLGWIETEGSAEPGKETEEYSSAAFGAVFVEVRVDETLGTIRVPRIVSAYDAGRIVDPKTASSQCIGGMVGGLGMALLEQAEWAPRFGKVMNTNLAEYLVPACADVRELEAVFVPSEDTRFNPSASRAWRGSRSAAWRRPPPIPSSMRLDGASVICRSRRRDCWPDVVEAARAP